MQKLVCFWWLPLPFSKNKSNERSSGSGLKQISGSLIWEAKCRQMCTNASKHKQTRATSKSRRYTHFCAPPLFRKILTPIKIKSALPPKRRNFMDMGFFPAERTHFPGAHEIGAAISSPRIADKQFYGHEVKIITGDAEKQRRASQL